MQHPDASAQSPGSVFSLEGIPPAGQLFPLDLQHTAAAVVGIITPAIMVACTCGLSGADRALLIQVSLIVTAPATLRDRAPLRVIAFFHNSALEVFSCLF